MNEWRAVAILAQAVELGSLRRAALAQGITPQAASQTLVQLERHLGVRLLHRTTRSLSLTDEGQLLLESARPALASLERALVRVRQARDEAAGPLRIVGPQSAFAPLLWPLLQTFCRQHPDVIPDVQLDDRVGNWVEDRVDVGFRIGVAPHEGVVARRLLPMQVVVCAAPAYLARHGVPQTLDELTQHRCSLFRHTATGRALPWFFRLGDECVTREMVPALTTNDAELEMQALLGGEVIGQLAVLNCAEHLRAGRLVPVLTPHMTDHMSLFIYWGSRKALPSRVRAFIDLAVAQLQDNPAHWLTAQELAAAAQAGARQAEAARARG